MRTERAYSRDGDQSFQDGDHGFQVMMITGSRDRDHSRRHAPTDVLMLCGNGVLVKGLASLVGASAARRACQGWPRLRGQPIGLGHDWPELGGRLDWSGLAGCRHLDCDAVDVSGAPRTHWVQAFFFSPARRRRLSPLSWTRWAL